MNNTALHLDKPFLSSSPRTFLFHHIGRSGGGDIDDICIELYGDATFHVTQRLGYERLDQYLSSSVTEQLKTKVITGHNTFGLHELIPNDYAYFTLLRDPVNEFLSQYYWFINGLGKEEHRKHISMPLEEFGIEHYIEYAEKNGFDTITETNWLATHWQGERTGKEARLAIKEPCSQEIFELAQDNLQQHYSFIGITEKYTESIFLLGKMMNWKRMIPYPHTNRAKRLVNRSTLAPELLERIRKIRFYDLKLYDQAVEWFEQLLEEQGVYQDPAFKDYQNQIIKNQAHVAKQEHSFYQKEFRQQHEKHSSD
jgi:hypothetical protein